MTSKVIVMPTITIHLSQEQLLELFQTQRVEIELPSISPKSERTEVLPPEGVSFFEFFKEQIQRKKDCGNLRTLETYRVAFKKFKIFMPTDILPSQMTDELMQSYQSYLRNENLSMNTISFYMRILRAVYHKAVEKGLTTDSRPFRHVYTGMAKTIKRALSLEEIKRIKNMRLEDSNLIFSRDMFLFSFYTRGMAFVDMAYLQTKDIKNGILTYKRHKTGQQLYINWEDEMQQIADRYPSKTERYLLRIIHTANGKERNQYRNLLTKVNKDLKEIGRMARLDQKLTMYCARHSWATIARQMNISNEIISQGMGHSNVRTTEIYLKSITAKTIDMANRKILDSL